jgi:osmotically-inducible protein OsmY
LTHNGLRAMGLFVTVARPALNCSLQIELQRLVAQPNSRLRRAPPCVPSTARSRLLHDSAHQRKETMKSAEAIQRDVVEELAWDPQVDSSAIAVTVEDRVALLSGHVSNYAEKLAAEKAARRIGGVKAVVDDIEVRLTKPAVAPDKIIAEAALHALRWNVNVPSKAIKVVVNKGWLKLAGEVDWNYQKTAADDAVHHLLGVKGVTNLIKVKQTSTVSTVKANIEAAFERNAEIDASQLTVEAREGVVTLIGRVRSWSEREQAEAAAWSAPGVSDVSNQLIVESAVATW